MVEALLITAYFLSLATVMWLTRRGRKDEDDD